MNPQEVVFKESGEVVGWACEKCSALFTPRIFGGGEGGAQHAKEGAAACCGPVLCKCGAESVRGWTVCRECRTRNETLREAEAYAKAPKLTLKEYLEKHPDGMLVWNDDHFVKASEVGDEDDVPEIVWCCDPTDLTLSAESILETALDEHYEDAIDSCDGDSLQKMLDEWCSAQGVRSWFAGKHALHPACIARLRLAREGESYE